MATLLKTDGSVLPIAGQLSLAEMQCLVGGYIELVTIGGTHDRREVLICDEEGRLKRKPLNVEATRLYQGEPARHDRVIVGDAIRGVLVNPGLDNESFE